MVKVTSRKGDRKVLLSFNRARRIMRERVSRRKAKNGRTKGNQRLVRNPSACINPHWGMRKSTPAYAEAITRSEAEKLRRVEWHIARIFSPARLPDTRISVFLYEHQYTNNLDGVQFLLWTRVSSVWPQLRTLVAVRTAAFDLLATSLRFKPHPDHASIVTKEANIDRRRGDTISMNYTAGNEIRIGECIRRGLNLLGRSAQWLRDLARQKTFREGSKKCYKLQDELEFLGFTTLLVSYDYSVIREKSVPRAGAPTVHDWPRRTHSRHRMQHLLAKIWDGSLMLVEDGSPVWCTSSTSRTNTSLSLSTNDGRRTVLGWVSQVSSKILKESDLEEIGLREQTGVVLFEGADHRRVSRIKDELVAVASSEGYLLSRHSAVRKCQALCLMLRTIEARTQARSGFFWTVEEERKVADYLVQNEGQPVDISELNKLVPTRTPAAISNRLKDKNNSGIINLIETILNEPAPEEDEDDGVDFDWQEEDVEDDDEEE